MNFINNKDNLPNNFDEVYILTDCKDCPINHATYINGFVPNAIMQCDKHYEKIDFTFFKKAREKEMENYVKRITHWFKKK